MKEKLTAVSLLLYFLPLNNYNGVTTPPCLARH